MIQMDRVYWYQLRYSKSRLLMEVKSPIRIDFDFTDDRFTSINLGDAEEGPGDVLVRITWSDRTVSDMLHISDLVNAVRDDRYVLVASWVSDY